jgi:spoIIIJ-associated protein
VESVEASGKSIEDAILQALVRLGRNRDEVEITVLQEPSRGTRGMGAREARVRVFVKAPRVLHPAGVELDPATDDPLDDEGDGNGFTIEAFADEGEAFEAGYETEYVESLSTAPLKDVVSDDASIEEVAVAALEMILAHMGVQASVEPAAIETDDEEEPVQLNIRSDDPGTLSLLIGRRGETLSALQLLVSLIVSKQTGNRERILVDAESYRLRREHNLRSMAERIAQQVRRSGNPVTLEAMPPNERRIIHMALSETTDIATESTGEGDQRRVVVSLKRGVRA